MAANDTLEGILFFVLFALVYLLPFFLHLPSIIMSYKFSHSLLLLILLLILAIAAPIPFLGVFYPLVVWRRKGWKASRWLAVPYLVWLLILLIPLVLLLSLHFGYDLFRNSAFVPVLLAIVALPPLLALVRALILWQMKGWKACRQLMAPYIIWLSVVLIGLTGYFAVTNSLWLKQQAKSIVTTVHGNGLLLSPLNSLRNKLI